MPSFKKTKKSVVLVKSERTPVETMPEASIPPASVDPPSSTVEGSDGDMTLVERAPSKNAFQSEAARQIWKTLGETATTAKGQIRRIVDKLGVDESLSLLAETQVVEANGGLMLPDGSRRRTPGGVFFFLVKTKYPDQFPVPTWKETKAKQKERKANQEQGSPDAVKPAPLPALNVDIPLDPEQKGTKVKLTLLGRPASRLEDKGSFVTFVMQSNKVPTLPKGLPAPDSAVTTNYVVHVVAKQWRKVAEALQDPEDFLVIEGFPQVNPKNGSITVFATNTTTRNLQRAAKEAQRAQAENQEPPS